MRKFRQEGHKPGALKKPGGSSVRAEKKFEKAKLMSKTEIKENKKYYSLLKKSNVFKGMSDEALPELMQKLGGYVRSFQKHEIVKNAGDNLSDLGIVLKGNIQASMPTDEKDQIIERFTEGETFAEAAVFAGKISPVEIRAVESSVLAFLPAEPILRGYADPDIARLGMNLLEETAKKTLKLSMKIRILKEKRLIVRIMMYMRSLTPDDNGVITLPYNKTELAQFLGVNRSSLSRELAEICDAGLIEMKKNRIKILNPIVREMMMQEVF